MDIKTISNENFAKYGKIINGFELDKLYSIMEGTPLPNNVIYVPSVTEMEETAVANRIQNEIFGELPIQIGYCNGKSNHLNALEYHKSSEINIACTDLIELVGLQQDISIVNGRFVYDTKNVEAFFIPKGTMLELYATTLHYAPINSDENGYRCIIVLHKDTNLNQMKKSDAKGETELLAARNKWLITHPESGIKGGYEGLVGENLCVRKEF